MASANALGMPSPRHQRLGFASYRAKISSLGLVPSSPARAAEAEVVTRTEWTQRQAERRKVRAHPSPAARLQAPLRRKCYLQRRVRKRQTIHHPPSEPRQTNRRSAPTSEPTHQTVRHQEQLRSSGRRRKVHRSRASRHRKVRHRRHRRSPVPKRRTNRRRAKTSARRQTVHRSAQKSARMHRTNHRTPQKMHQTRVSPQTRQIHRTQASPPQTARRQTNRRLRLPEPRRQTNHPWTVLRRTLALNRRSQEWLHLY